MIYILQSAIYMPEATDVDGTWQDACIYTLPRPNRHWELLRLVFVDYGMNHKRKSEQGFVTNEGTFVDREIAGFIALQAGQSKRPNRHLTSEDIY